MVGLQVLRSKLEPPSREEALDAIEWRFASARHQGRSHADASVPCQDHVAVLADSDGTVVGSLADGAGSAKLSHYGAEILADLASRLVAQQFDQLFRATNNLGTLRASLATDLLNALVTSAAKGLDVSADDRARLDLPDRSAEPLIKCDVRDLAATLLVVAVRGDRFITLHLGDGVIGVEHVLKGGTRVVRALGIPDNGEFINETKFITSRDAAGSIRVYRGRVTTSSRAVTGFVMMSDGPEASLYIRSTRTMAGACSKLLQACRDLPTETMHEQLAETLRDVIVPRTHDDCSLVLIALAQDSTSNDDEPAEPAGTNPREAQP